MHAIILIIAIVVMIGALYCAWIVSQYASPFIPTSRKKAQQMIDFAELNSRDVVMDLGSGDGRIVLMCADRVKKAIGIEINALLVWLSSFLARVLKKSNVAFVHADFWQTDISDVDVLMLFCIKSEMPKLKDKIQSEMKPGSRVVSNIFTFADWEPVREEQGVRLYVVS